MIWGKGALAPSKLKIEDGNVFGGILLAQHLPSLIKEVDMVLQRQEFLSMLKNIKIKDIPHLAENSYANHHTAGLFYICLKRTDKETIKIYYMPDIRNECSGFLVHPHNHRYEFDSILLQGEIEHLRFKENKWGTPWHTNSRLFKYDSENKEVKFVGRTNLDLIQHDEVLPGEIYNVKTDEIHTLKMIKGRVIIGLAQYKDEDIEQKLFIPTPSDFVKSDPPHMAATMYVRMVNKVIEELENGEG